MKSKDLFSSQAGEYARSRPGYPTALFDFLASLCPRRDTVWDCATGSGQAAVPLAERFKHVVATDRSDAQLANAVARPNIRYAVGSAEAPPLDDHSVDLVTVAQAFHWFQHEEFFQAVRRVARDENSVCALWCYGISTIDAEVDRIALPFYSERLDPFWEPERRWVEDAYASLPFPFAPIASPPFTLQVQWSVDQYLGYLRSWSAVATAKKKLGVDLVDEIEPPLRAAWGAQTRTVTWPLTLRVGHVR